MTETTLVVPAAALIHDGFCVYQEQFRGITRRAKQRFERAQWDSDDSDFTKERIELRENVLANVLAAIRRLLGEQAQQRSIWSSIKSMYSGMISDRDDWEIAETFYNSVTRRIFSTVGVDPNIEFVDSDFDYPPVLARGSVFRIYSSSPQSQKVREILVDAGFDAPYEDLERDADLLGQELPSEPFQACIIRSVFYRGKGAYLVGLLQQKNRKIPIAIALRSSSNGIFVDAVLLSEDEISILFSFTRSYFHVEAERPYDLVRFLQSIMPRKRISELYTSIGYHKHGKTELYRDLLNHLHRTNDQFELAPGDRGMVMLVFHLPSFEAVFKIIRDYFEDPKKGTTRAGVMTNYNLVFKHDRVGRLIDAQEFEHLAFDRSRFSESLIREMQEKAAGVVQINDNSIVIRHLYVERRVTPLNLFLQNDGDAARDAVIDYGRAIHDLAAANIFPGDLLLKNFGVTRHGRVVSYDYDELCLITDLNFRQIPSTRSEEEEFSAEQWFRVADNDIFPEEFARWMGLPPELRQVFWQHHSVLFEVDFWRNVQAKLLQGERIEILPYPENRRIQRRDAAFSVNR